MSAFKSGLKNLSFETHTNNTQIKTMQIRKRSVIMFTDIAGFTNMIDDNEEWALQIITINRRIQRLCIAHHNGSWIKEMGDGILSSFNNASQAILCALDIQRAVCSVPGLKLHIGIHQSEVVFIGDDVFGLGVNIASRIQEAASPGQILASENVVGNVNGQKKYQARFFSDKKLKNVKDHIRIYRIVECQDKN